MAAYKHFNVLELESIAHGDDAFISKWLEKCSKRSEELLQQFESACREKNMNEIKQIAHQLRPSFFYLGRNDLAKILEDFENNSSSFSNTDFETKLSFLISSTKELFGEIEEILKK